ncbi:hypothetical protein, partial [Streptomyces sp. 6N223]|uniref:hypothetical protein n=1 Tax=Streptomyces sp. 6N223 TaxID=3457412 RepID=UPI003FD4A0CD
MAASYLLLRVERWSDISLSAAAEPGVGVLVQGQSGPLAIGAFLEDLLHPCVLGEQGDIGVPVSLQDVD